MSKYLNTFGNPTLAIGICARCSRKFPVAALKPDRDKPGLLVCDADNDVFDPYRKPARSTENIAIPNARPDAQITSNASYTVSGSGSVQSAPVPSNLEVKPSST